MIYNDYSEVTNTFVDDGTPDEHKLERKEVSKKGKKQNTITAYEHKPLSIKEWCLTGRELECLERLDQSLDGTFFKLETKNIRFTNWVGAIGIGSRTIEILPKIDYTKNDNSEENKNLCRDRLLAMLAIAGDIPYKFSTKASLSSKNITILEFFIRLYVKEACKLLKRGLVHNYIKHEDETNFLRGKLNVAEQVRLTARRIPRFSVKYHEFSADILLNRIIKDVSRMLQSITQNYENQRELLLIDAILEEVSFKRHTVKDVDRIILDRKTHGYEMLLALCRLFLQKRIPDFSAGETPVIPILFNMNTLFERFIGKMFKRMLSYDMPPSFCDVRLDESNKHLLQRWDNGRWEPFKKLRPDIQLVGKSNNNNVMPLIIIDTKWKRLNSKIPLNDIDDSDLHQMFAYAIRYQSERTILLYPKPAGLECDNGLIEHFRTEEGQPIEIWAIDLTNTNKEGKENTFYKSIKDQLKIIVEWTIPENGKSKEQ